MPISKKDKIIYCQKFRETIEKRLNTIFGSIIPGN